MTATTNERPQPQRIILAVRPPSAVGGKNAPEENSADLTKSL